MDTTGKILMGVGALALIGGMGVGGYMLWRKYGPSDEPDVPAVPDAPPPATDAPADSTAMKSSGIGRVRTPVMRSIW